MPSNILSSASSKLWNTILYELPLKSREKKIAIESYREPAHRFLPKDATVPEQAYDQRIFDVVRYSKRYRYDAIIAHGIHANVLSNFAWHYFDCPKWVCDRGFIKGSVMFDKFSTETDDSELQMVKIRQNPLSKECKNLLKGLENPLVENQTRRNFKKTKKGKNLVYALSRIRNEINIKGCLSGLTELQIISFLSKELPQHWNLIVKERGKYKLILGGDDLPENVYIAAGDTDVHYLIEMSDAVISFISKMGLDAAVKGKVVLTMGAAHYSHFGFTRDLEQVSQLKELLEMGPMSEVEKKNLNSFLEYYLQNYLIFPHRQSNPQLEKIVKTIAK